MAQLSRVYIDSWNYLTLYAEETGTNTEGNYSSVHSWLDLHVEGHVSSSSITVGVTGGSADLGYQYWGAGDYTLVNGYYNAPHNVDGSGSSDVSAYFSSAIGYWSLAGTLPLTQINRQATVTSATDFNDEGNPTITFSNPAGYRINARLEFRGSHIQRDNIPNTGSYTFDLTNEERALLREKCIENTMTVRQVIATCYSGTTESIWSWQDKKMTIINANPIFSSFEVEDINPITLALTGNSSVNVNGYSNIEATIFSASQKAIAQKSASMVKYRFKIGNSSVDIPYDDEIDESGIINNASTGIYEMYAIDSRNNSTLVTKQATTIIDYTNISINKDNCSLVRDSNQVGENAILTINGSFWNNNFGITTNNIKSVTYRFKKTDSSTWIDGTTTITPTTSNNDFTFTGLIASDNQDTTWDLDASYNVEVTVSDELSSATVDFILNSAIPTLCLDKNGVGIMCAYDNDLGGLLQVGGQVIDPDFKKTEITTGGNPVKTGRIIDGKEEYIYQEHISSLPNTSSGWYETSIAIADIELVSDIGGTGLRSSTNDWFVLNASRQNVTTNISVSGSVRNNNFAFYIETGMDRTDLEAWVYIKFTYKD